MTLVKLLHIAIPFLILCGLVYCISDPKRKEKKIMESETDFHQEAQRPFINRE